MALFSNLDTPNSQAVSALVSQPTPQHSTPSVNFAKFQKDEKGFSYKLYRSSCWCCSATTVKWTIRFLMIVCLVMSVLSCVFWETFKIRGFHLVFVFVGLLLMFVFLSFPKITNYLYTKPLEFSDLEIPTTTQKYNAQKRVQLIMNIVSPIVICYLIYTIGEFFSTDNWQIVVNQLLSILSTYFIVQQNIYNWVLQGCVCWIRQTEQVPPSSSSSLSLHDNSKSNESALTAV